MKKLFVVTSGEYSDYVILAVFDSRKLAKKFIVALPISRSDRRLFCNFQIEEFTLNPFELELSSSKKIFYIEMDRNGKVERTLFDTYWSESRVEGVGRLDLRYNKTSISGYIFARNKRHAIKIANEKRAQLIATNQWPVMEPILTESGQRELDAQKKLELAKVYLERRKEGK